MTGGGVGLGAVDCNGDGGGRSAGRDPDYRVMRGNAVGNDRVKAREDARWVGGARVRWETGVRRKASGVGVIAGKATRRAAGGTSGVD